MNIEIKTNKGNEFDIADSIYLTSEGESNISNAALSFYNTELQFGISYFPDRNMIVFQTDYYDEEYWNDEKTKSLEEELSKYIDFDNNTYGELQFDLEKIVNIILNEMDNYYDWLNEKYSDFAEFLNNFLKE